MFDKYTGFILSLIKHYKGYFIFILGILFNLLESLYFGQGTARGFNHQAESIAEFVCDDIALALMILGFFMMMLQAAREKSTVINTSKVYVFNQYRRKINHGHTK
jgi:hypothetical protein